MMFDDGLLKMGGDGRYECVRDEAESQSIRTEVMKTKMRQTMDS